MADPDPKEITFEGEEADAGLASPALDLIASAVLVVITLVVMVASWRLPMPGEIHTAPGLLPFLVAASLLVMAVGLGASAMARRRSGASSPMLAERDLSTDLRSLLLAGAVAVYIAALQNLAFQKDFNAFGKTLSLSAFEPATIVVLSAIIHLSWRGPLWITAAVTVAWTAILSLVFQLVFRLPLPGTF